MPASVEVPLNGNRHRQDHSRQVRLDGGQANALRHGLYAALLSKNNGAGFARAHLHAHEQDNDSWFSFGRGGCDDERDTAIDRHNNEVGIALGPRYDSDADLVAEIRAIFIGYAPMPGGVGYFDVTSECG